MSPHVYSTEKNSKLLLHLFMLFKNLKLFISVVNFHIFPSKTSTHLLIIWRTKMNLVFGLFLIMICSSSHVALILLPLLSCCDYVTSLNNYSTKLPSHFLYISLSILAHKFLYLFWKILGILSEMNTAGRDSRSITDFPSYPSFSKSCGLYHQKRSSIPPTISVGWW